MPPRWIYKIDRVSSSSNKIYTLSISGGGRLECSCMAWTRSKDKSKHCKHIKDWLEESWQEIARQASDNGILHSLVAKNPEIFQIARRSADMKEAEWIINAHYQNVRDTPVTQNDEDAMNPDMNPATTEIDTKVSAEAQKPQETALQRIQRKARFA